jgi:uncharacterized membrane protein
MRQFIKFLHTLGAIGMMGAMACLLVLLAFLPPPSQLNETAAMRGAMGAIASWIFLPSLALTLVAGLLAMAANRFYQNAGWAWVKLATGVLVFEGGFAGVVGPMQDEAARSAQALAGAADAAAQAPGAETNTIVVLMAIALVNVMLGVWRPRLMRRG